MLDIELNSSYDVVYAINVPGDYYINFDTGGACNLPTLQETVPIPSDVSIISNVEVPACPGYPGSVSGSLGGSSGIYQVFIDGTFSSETSVGLDDLEFGVWFNQSEPSQPGNNTIDCNGELI